ncbi:MAG: glucosamine-6-phosphate deaminase [Clostridia bacterium]|nr:glucosamine-6-phosphate deaminase [Clostridia bacterium]
MQISVFSTKEQIGRAAAALIASQLLLKPESVLGLATGSSPIPTYQELQHLYRDGILDFSRAHSFNLDEYVGLDGTHPCSYRYFMNEQLFDHINLPLSETHVPDGNAADLVAAAREYDAAIDRAGGIDLQILGIGRNGHIGFNEPADVFTTECHVVDLTESTIEANTRFFASRDDVPRKAISLGVGQIMKARTVLLIATGSDKAEAIAASVMGPITPRVPASILQSHHNVIFLLDQAAAQKLPA